MKVTLQEFTNFCNSGEVGWIKNDKAIDLMFGLEDDPEILQRDDFPLWVSCHIKDCGFTPYWVSRITQYIRDNA